MGFVDQRGVLDKNAVHQLPEMASALTHRGPDQAGQWHEEDVALAHRRLSVLDTSEAGLQPMSSRSGRFVLVFNGEIYNYRELRKQLITEHGLQLLSNSDTEVLLEYISHFGVEKTLRNLNGMYAFAVWDRKEKALFLARDRMGIKPLYWARRDNQILFASETRAFYSHPAWTMEMSDVGLWDYFNNTYISEDRTAFKNCWKLQPGHFLTWKRGGDVKVQKFWSLLDQARQRPELSAKCRTFKDSVAELDALLDNVIGDQCQSDVPLGAFLSGGVDSSTVVSFLRKHGQVKTFSIGYEEADFDESKEASSIAGYLGTDHTDFILKPSDAVDVIPNIPDIYDEPFADPSQIPTHMVSQIARKDVTVSLSGDGGDELFAGYQRYEQNAATWRNIEMIPTWGRKPLAGIMSAIPANWWGFLLRPVLADASQSIPFYASLMRNKTVASYHREANYLGVGDACILEKRAAQDGNELFYTNLGMRSALDDLLYVDQCRRLPDCMLTKVDRASMACGLEVRVPLLDNRVVDFAWSLPTDHLIRNGQRKAVLREVLARYVPRELFDMPKKGFHIPLKIWLSGPLRDWAETLFDEGLKDASEYIDASTVRSMWARYLQGEVGLTNPLWVVLMFLAWRQSLKAKA
ncbi:MAG: asparagine synthase (glutamine-hydrolyzing) [Thalassospira sp.]|uniref:asparagine synthase (glutamine-hydrolyzing) n=1 Tax=Thalassospira sp. TaxID=1912094 RepID=UPI0032EEA35C